MRRARGRDHNGNVVSGTYWFFTASADSLVPARMLSERGSAGAKVAQLADGTWAVLDLGAFLDAAELHDLDVAIASTA